MENIYVQFEDRVNQQLVGIRVNQQLVGIPMGTCTNFAPLIADLVLYCYEKYFMSNLHKSKKLDLVDKFNDTSRYLDYTRILTIDNPEFVQHISDIYPAAKQMHVTKKLLFSCKY